MSKIVITKSIVANNSKAIVEAVNQGEPKSRIARKLGVGTSALNAAFVREGRLDLVPPWYLRATGRSPRKGETTSQTKAAKTSKSPSAIEVASALLEEAAKAINREEAYRSEVSLLTEVVGKLEREVTSLKKSLAEEVNLLKQKELEVERYRKIHNTIVEESKKGNKPLPTVDSILELLRKRGARL